MADKLLESGAVSAFCSSVATMLAAGIQTDEAVHMLSENRDQSEFKRVCDAVYAKLIEGVGLADSLDEIDNGTVIIRAHGVVPETIEQARAAGL